MNYFQISKFKIPAVVFVARTRSRFIARRPAPLEAYHHRGVPASERSRHSRYRPPAPSPFPSPSPPGPRRRALPSGRGGRRSVAVPNLSLADPATATASAPPAFAALYVVDDDERRFRICVRARDAVAVAVAKPPVLAPPRSPVDAALAADSSSTSSSSSSSSSSSAAVFVVVVVVGEVVEPDDLLPDKTEFGLVPEYSARVDPPVASGGQRMPVPHLGQSIRHLLDRVHLLKA